MATKTTKQEAFKDLANKLDGFFEDEGNATAIAKYNLKGVVMALIVDSMHDKAKLAALAQELKDGGRPSAIELSLVFRSMKGFEELQEKFASVLLAIAEFMTEHEVSGEETMAIVTYVKNAR